MQVTKPFSFSVRELSAFPQTSQLHLWGKKKEGRGRGREKRVKREEEKWARERKEREEM